MLSRLHHVGRLTRDFEEAITYYRDVIGGETEARSTDDDLVRTACVESETIPGLAIHVNGLDGGT